MYFPIHLLISTSMPILSIYFCKYQTLSIDASECPGVFMKENLCPPLQIMHKYNSIKISGSSSSPQLYYFLWSVQKEGKFWHNSDQLHPTLSNFCLVFYKSSRKKFDSKSLSIKSSESTNRDRRIKVEIQKCIQGQSNVAIYHHRVWVDLQLLQLKITQRLICSTYTSNYASL